jgi:hypothetical protein
VWEYWEVSRRRGRQATNWRRRGNSKNWRGSGKARKRWNARRNRIAALSFISGWWRWGYITTKRRRRRETIATEGRRRRRRRKIVFLSDRGRCSGCRCHANRMYLTWS